MWLSHNVVTETFWLLFPFLITDLWSCGDQQREENKYFVEEETDADVQIAGRDPDKLTEIIDMILFRKSLLLYS